MPYMASYGQANPDCLAIDILKSYGFGDVSLDPPCFGVLLTPILTLGTTEDSVVFFSVNLDQRIQEATRPYKTRWWFQIFLFSSQISNLTNIFQMG